MNTPTEQLIEDVRIRLFEAGIAPDVIRGVESVLDLSLSRYDIKEREVQLVVYDAGDTELVQKYFISKAVQGCTERTLDTYRRVLSFCMKGIQKHLKDITSDDIRALLAYLKIQGRSSAYIALNQRALSSFFTWCEKNGLIVPNPMNKVERTKVRVRQEEALTLEQMEMVRSAANTRRDKAIIEMLYSTGCRISELCALNKTDIDWENMEATVLGKGKKYRTVYITQRAKYAYKDYEKVRRDKSPALFGWDPEAQGGQIGLKALREFAGKDFDWDTARLDANTIGSMLRSVGKKCGFRLHPHLLRKTVATHALQRGMPIDEVRIMLGHDSIATTTIYAQTLKDNIKDSHEKYV